MDVLYRLATYYKKKYQTDPVFREKHKEQSRKNYQKRKEVLKQQYEATKELKLFIRNYKYNKKIGKLDRFMDKYPELYEKYKDHIQESED